MAGYEVAHVDELPAHGDTEPGGAVWKSLRAHFGIGAFGASCYVAERAGQRVVPEHDEASAGKGTQAAHEELYAVLRGHATFSVGHDDVDAPAGTLVFVRDPALVRTAFARDDDTVVLAVGGAPHEAFVVSPWEARATGG
jgi:hypothetical protein